VTKIKLNTTFTPLYDQKKAIEDLSQNVKNDISYQTLLGVTGSGKTFTVANVVEQTQLPTLIISHNKTLAAQLYQEFRDFFPENAVSYFVSYYDYYQPEAYIPQTDTYIEKDADINELIERFRLSTTNNILTRKDTIVIASVSCIYNIGSPNQYKQFFLEFALGMITTREQFIHRLVDLQYERGEFGFHHGTFRVRGDAIEVFLAYSDDAVRIEFIENKIKAIQTMDPLTGKLKENHKAYSIFPSKHFIADTKTQYQVFDEIREDLEKQVKKFKDEGKDLEAHRIAQKVTYELEMIQEIGYVKGIENYSRYFDGRKPGDAPYSLLDYFNETYGKDWLLIVDESHITFPQVRGMHAGDFSRKKTLVDYGFRLPSAFDNRPLKFDEFLRRVPKFIAVSATPADWELSMSQSYIIEQLMRPTGIPDPEVEIRKIQNQVADVIKEVEIRAKKGERTLITTLTKKTAEDLAEFMKEQGLKVHYLHSDVDTLARTDILEDLRSGKYDALIGINLLREGLDLPEVSLVAILDADKEGFLRSDVTLIQTMGRAARHIEGKVILYADTITGSIQRALDEVSRRREYQLEQNKKYGITPKSISKPIREKIIDRDREEESVWEMGSNATSFASLPEIYIEGLTPMDKKKLAKKLKAEMKLAAEDLNFELAIAIRDKIKELE